MALTLFGLGKLLTNVGYPFGGGPEVEFSSDDVVAFAKVTAWGDASTKFWVRLADGRDVFINASKQEKRAEKWIRRIAKRVLARAAGREVGWRMFWTDVTDADRAAATQPGLACYTPGKETT